MSQTLNEITHDAVYNVIYANDKVWMDLTGRFPYFSNQGNEYILIVYHCDYNAIVEVPLKIQQAVTIKKA